MGSETPRTVRDPQATPTCQACGQPVGIHAKRHKVLGAWVPEWEVQPCRNPRCARYERPEGAEGPEGGGEAAPEGGEEAAPEDGAEGGTEAATTHVTGKNGEIGRSPATG
ncbi:hypothetical protein [Streptomyces sp. NPDC058579]|uniref:hypothetical protein n=1 Tax=Streptomyces sp. NPDC058579 TaxID=3346548 RepID=UPI00364FB228